MTLHTIVPLELVLEGITSQSSEQPAVEVQAGEMRLLVQPLYPGAGRIIRILDCPLHHYLRPELAPGSVFMYGNVQE